MTLEDLQKMSNEQIEILVHEKIMGQCAHRLTKDPAYQGQVKHYYCCKCNKTGFDYLTDFEGRIVGPKAYCTDRNSAGEVLEKVKDMPAPEQDRFYAAVLDLVGYVEVRASSGTITEAQAKLIVPAVQVSLFDLLTAPPRTLILAALMAIGEER